MAPTSLEKENAALGKLQLVLDKMGLADQGWKVDIRDSHAKYGTNSSRVLVMKHRDLLELQSKDYARVYPHGDGDRPVKPSPEQQIKMEEYKHEMAHFKRNQDARAIGRALHCNDIRGEVKQFRDQQEDKLAEVQKTLETVLGVMAVSLQSNTKMQLDVTGNGHPVTFSANARIAIPAAYILDNPEAEKNMNRVLEAQGKPGDLRAVRAIARGRMPDIQPSGQGAY